MISASNLTNFEKNLVNKLSDSDKELFFNLIPLELKKNNATLISHYYTDPIIQLITEKTKGKVADSLEMARFGKQCSSKTLVISGVHFMGESAKILNPDKTVIMPDLGATCSLDIGCKYDDFKEFIKQNPGREVVVYANTSAAVKSLADWVVTSSNALDIVNHLKNKNKKILWAPDKYLGNYIKSKTSADMAIWQGECIVHAEFKTKKLKIMKKMYPNAAVLVHPESPASVVAEADVVGSTSVLISAVAQLPNPEFIVATDKGIFYKMQQAAPNKKLLSAPTEEDGSKCNSCSSCPWMALNSLKGIYKCLISRIDNQIKINPDIEYKAKKPMDRMVDYQNIINS